MKLNTLFIALIVLSLGSCKETGEQEAKSNMQQEQTTDQQQDSLPDEDVHYADASIGTEERKENVQIEEILGTSLDNWQSRQVARLSIDDLKKITKEDIPAITIEIKKNLRTMYEEIPIDSRSENVQQHYDLVIQELDQLQEVLDEEGVNEEKIYAQVDKVVQSYDKLEEQLGQSLNAKDNS